VRRRGLLGVLALALVGVTGLGGGVPTAHAIQTAQCLKRWHTVPFPLRGTVTFTSVAVHGSRAWVLGRSDAEPVIERWRAPAWHLMPVPATTRSEVLNAIAASGPDDIWVVGGRYGATGSAPVPIAIHWDGEAWTRFHVPGAIVSPSLGGGGGNLEHVTAAGHDNVWAVGYGKSFDDGNNDSLIVHWNGAGWKRSSWSGGDTGAGISVGRDGRVWAVGSTSKEFTELEAAVRSGGVWQSAGVSWENDWWESWLFGVAATGANVWAVGGYYQPDQTGPIIERWQDGLFVIVPVEGQIDQGFTGVTEVRSHAFALGADSTAGPVIERWRNGTWRPVHIPAGWATRLLTSIAAGPDGSIWAVGSFIARSCIGPV
jgi:hypothetical protein